MQANVSVGDKLTVLQAHLSPIMNELGTLANGKELTGDDLVDFFAMGIAAILDNDTHLTTPRAIRLASENAGKVIEQRTRNFREINEAAGMSALSILRSGIPLGQFAD